MTTAPLLRTAGIFSWLAPLAILAGVPIAASLRGVGGPGPIDFGNAELLAELALAAPRTVWVDALALLGPVLGLPVGVGWYVLVREQKALALFGTLLWYLGMIFIVMQDAVQLAIVATLPGAFAAAETAVKPALAAFGASFASIIRVVSAVGAVSYVGAGVLAVALLRVPRFPKWLAVLGIVASVLPCVGLLAPLLGPGAAWLGIGLPLGVLAFVVLFTPATGVVMLRWKY